MVTEVPGRGRLLTFPVRPLRGPAGHRERDGIRIRPFRPFATMSGLRIDVADLLAHPGARRHVRVAAQLDELAGSAARITGPVEVVVTLDRISDGIVVRGTVSGQWSGECSLCLRDIHEDVELHVDELFETTPIEGETYPIADNEIGLEQLVRDTVLLELPLAPHCAEPCGPDVQLDADDDGDETLDLPPDPRWAALSELEIQ